MKPSLHLESITRPLEYHDPILLFHHLVRGEPNRLLLESAEIDSKRHLKSYLLIRAAATIECVGRRVTASALTPNGRRLVRALARNLNTAWDESSAACTLEYGDPPADLDEDRRLAAESVFTPLRALRRLTQINSNVPEALFVGGLFSYDLIECFEPLPQLGSPGICPNYRFYVAEQLIRLDHLAHTSQLIGSWFYETYQDDERRRLEQELRETEHQCQNLSAVDLPPARLAVGEAESDVSDEQFQAVVRRLQQHVECGDVFQIVPSRSFSLPCPHPLRAYRQLRRLNPSPYMFYMQDAAFTLFGASPEMAVKFTEGTRQVELCPIAGTRRRGKSPDGSIHLDLDSRIELELRTDTKEMAEHLMLVDLARNDLARICEPGTRHIAQLLKVDRYSHVMHLVSRVVGQLRGEFDALHAYQACMNMGTLTGAPKVRAMQLIREVEEKRRDSYGGGLGYFLGNGDMETCIVIRSALVADDRARVQAGAGVVYDSDPRAEAEETRSKAAAVIAALQAAHVG